MNPARAGFRGYFLVGPTAVGKTAIAQWIAERHGYEILSADSMLVYRGMNIGTAKPSDKDRALVRYHGLDLTNPDKPFNVWEYRKSALESARDAAARGKELIVVGGSGLHVKSLTDGLSPAAASDPATREHWNSVLKREGIETLRNVLREKNRRLYDSIADTDNPRRLIRALEQAESHTEQAVCSWQESKQVVPLAGLSLPADQLKTRIESRVRDMYRLGLMEEVRSILDSGVELSTTARQAIGYAEAIDLLQGKCTTEEAVARTITRTRQLAKRQMTWFRNKTNVQWIELSAGMSPTDIAQKVTAHWEKHGPTEIRT